MLSVNEADGFPADADVHLNSEAYGKQTKTGIALLHDEVSGHTYDVRLKLTEEVLTIQKQDVVCVSGSRPSTNSGTAEKPQELDGSVQVARQSRVEPGRILAGGQVNGINVESAAPEEAGLLGTRRVDLQMKMANKCCSPCDQVVHMGWVSERLAGAGSSQTFRPRFLALKGSSLYVFVSPSVSTLDWVRAEKTYHLCEVLFKVHKSVKDGKVGADGRKSLSKCKQRFGLEIPPLWLPDNFWAQASLSPGLQDPDGGDHGPFCFSVLVGHGGSHVFGVELGSELAAWELSFQRATFRAVQRTGSKTYACGGQGDTLCFTVDFALGFTCFDSKTKSTKDCLPLQSVLWRFKFCQLKGSSDDGKARVKLLFQSLDTKQIEMKELEFQDLVAVLHCVHSFMAAKVASVDPAFMDTQSLAGRYMCSS
ncbi:hypothetical protein JEQ12_008658 [Ovis aries]|uniref:PH domain-containing protein n=1 Tax=Ovis aries TaxID=9940 RepID=A0A836D8J3_SHEEP|nr:hypothetical protein JEQ12_008658 [Ovis aries]